MQGFLWVDLLPIKHARSSRFGVFQGLDILVGDYPKSAALPCSRVLGRVAVLDIAVLGEVGLQGLVSRILAQVADEQLALIGKRNTLKERRKGYNNYRKAGLKKLPPLWSLLHFDVSTNLLTAKLLVAGALSTAEREKRVITTVTSNTHNQISTILVLRS